MRETLFMDNKLVLEDTVRRKNCKYFAENKGFGKLCP
jgi:hypothetical protein